MSIQESGSENIHAHYKPTDYNKVATMHYGEVLDKDNNAEVQSKVLNKTVKIWENSRVDLARIGILEINGEVVEDLPNHIAPTPDEVVDKILLATNKDEEATQQITKLLQQAWVGELNIFLLRKNTEEISGKEEELGSPTTPMYDKTLSKVTDKHTVNVDKNNFKVSHEALYKVRHLTESGGVVMDAYGEPVDSYVKAKLVISGTIKDLKQSNIRNIDVKLLNTEERSSLAEARKEGYGPLIYRLKEDYRSTIS